MKSLIVFYIPTDAVPTHRKDRRKMRKEFEKNVPDAHIILIEDPNRLKVETEVFFNPYQK